MASTSLKWHGQNLYMKHHVRDFAANRSILDLVSPRAVALSRSVLTALFASDHTAR